MINLDKKLINIIGSVSILLLIMTFAMEYYYSLHACKLCSYQRMGYFIIFILWVVSLIIPSSSRKIKTLIFIFLATVVALSLAQVLLEQHLINLNIGCTLNISKHDSYEDFKAAILGSNTEVPCDQNTFYFLGLSLATHSFLISLALLIMFLPSLILKKKK